MGMSYSCLSNTKEKEELEVRHFIELEYNGFRQGIYIDKNSPLLEDLSKE